MATSNRLEGMNVAILVENRFEQVELTEPRKALDQAGARTVVVSPQKDKVQGMNHDDPGDTIDVDLPLEQAQPDRFDALLLPGGVVNPDRLRMNRKAMDFVRAFVDAGKPIAAICHGPWSLVEVDAVRQLQQRIRRLQKLRVCHEFLPLNCEAEQPGARYCERH